LAESRGRVVREDRVQRSREDYRHLIYQSATGSHEGRRTLLSGALALVVFLLLVALSARQVTEPDHARRLIEAGIASTTEIDRVIAEDQPALIQFTQTSAANGFAIPGYPLSVYLGRDEVGLPPAQLRGVILSRSSTLVYEDGLNAFDRTGSQSFSRFSSQGLLDLVAAQVSADTYARASTSAALLTVLLGVLAGAVLVSHSGWTRLRVLGIAVLGGAAPVAFLAAIVRLLVGRVGGSDLYVGDLRSLAESVSDVPLRDAAIVTIAALVLVIAGSAFDFMDRGFARPDPDPSVTAVSDRDASLDALADD
jgi:hypothetical protein